MKPRFWIPIVHDLEGKLEEAVVELAEPVITLLASFGITCEVIYHAPYDDVDDNDLDASINPAQCFGFIVCSDKSSLAGWFAEGQEKLIVAIPIAQHPKQASDTLLELATAQRPGYPYVIMGINSVFNAALACIQVLAQSDTEIDRLWHEYSTKAQREAERAANEFTFPM